MLVKHSLDATKSNMALFSFTSTRCAWLVQHIAMSMGLMSMKEFTVIMYTIHHQIITNVEL